jgi:predicted MPP superfamily phosphohydrolase
MAITPILISTLVLIFLWLYLRKSFFKNIFSIYQISKKWLITVDLFFLYTLLFRFSTKLSPHLIAKPWFKFLYVTSYVSLGFLGLISFILILSDLEDLANLAFQKISTKKFNQDRRKFLKKTFLLGGFVSSGVITGAGIQNSFDPKIVEVSIPLKNKHKKLSGLKIVQLSDIHIGPTLKKDFAEMLVLRTNKLNPDIIVLTGDLIDGLVQDIGDDLLPFKNFKAKYGVYYITGNHEYYWKANEWIQFLDTLNMKGLHNQNIKLEHNAEVFYLAGVTDLYSSRYDEKNATNVKRAYQNIADENFSILLAHQPKTVFEANKFAFNLQLSGHTHGGQGFPWNILVRIAQPYIKGLYMHEKMHLYVNAGTGFWGPPNRFMINSEITSIVLT